jgi:hypothetical protein
VNNISDLNSRWSRVGSDLVFTGGNVGIGVNPGVKLDVIGNMRVSGDMGKVCVTRDTVDTPWSQCPADHPYWVMGFNSPTNVASPEYNYWHSNTAMWICCK